MHLATLALEGLSLIDNGSTTHRGEVFHAVNPASGEVLEPAFYSACADDLDRAAGLAAIAAPTFAATPGTQRAALLRAMADGLTANAEPIVARANLETGLPLPRLQGELVRTTGQLKQFASLLEEGSWVDARIDRALLERKPLPRADLRSMLLALGPVAVFGASNFPLAFSVAGGDTASALAAGCPVIVKAHPAHPGTSELVGRVLHQAVGEAGLPPGVFALLFDAGTAIGSALVQQPAIKAVGFTGSSAGGQALMRLAATRPEPIPCYAEMGSANPLFILPGALRERGAYLAADLQSSFTLGSGQFCTKPGLIFVPQGEAESFLETLRTGVTALGYHGMLTSGIAERYTSVIRQSVSESRAQLFAGEQPPETSTGGPVHALPTVLSVAVADYFKRPELEHEIFGPTILLIHYGEPADLLIAAQQLHGHLTATIHAAPDDLAHACELMHILETRVGRILFNSYPTGVEVSPAMVHGGPFPATSDSRSSSVGTRAILRFARPVCFQDVPSTLLPSELQPENPLGILRLVDSAFTREPA
ncbi:aldehyde dehydrogenase (NADP(+)) [Granulicella sp. S190]|uniref:aldehyde dehydrogenase (NADP(+)) n=1 Tax=Granulicella sp. S190 TaxID=1747226 RepID=UPI00131DF1C2|nr:aldehyde dehydrogenase (NADP(+)) [Granulicella sp. S190]